MESNETGWRAVSNTVADRMIDSSLIHKLIPRRRLKRRTKAMNTVIKQFHRLKTYIQYVKMKTSILRNLSDDSETDDAASFTEDDYYILSRSNLSFEEYATRKSSVNTTEYSDESDFDVNDDNIACNITNENTSTRRSTNEPGKIINLGWQEVIKRKTNSTCSFENKTSRKTLSDCNSNVSPTRNNSQFSFNRSMLRDNEGDMDREEVQDEANVSRDGTQLYSETANSNVVTSTPGEQITSTSIKKFLGNTNTVIPSTMEGIRKNLTPLLDIVSTVENNDKSNIAMETHSTVDCHNLSSENSEIPETCVDVKSDDKFLQIPRSVGYSVSQPKDSGIEEDTEEELSENKKIFSTEKIYKLQEERSAMHTCDNTNYSSTDPNSTTSDDSTIHGVSLTDRNVSNSKSFQNMHLSETNINNTKELTEKPRKTKLQPTVTAMESINRRYIIIPCEDVLQNNCTNLDESNTKNTCDTEILERLETEEYSEYNTSPTRESHSRQLSRLNLTTDSCSSLSEDDDEHNNTENIRVKLFGRSTEPSDASEDEHASINSEHTNVNAEQDIPKGENIKQQNLYPIKSHRKNTEKEEGTRNSKRLARALKLTKSNDHSCIDASKTFSMKNFHTTEPHREKTEDQDNRESTRRNKEVVTNTELENKNSMIQDRPCNLQELIEQDNLTLENPTPSFKFKEINEDDIFILDIPSMVLERQLLGKKIIITENYLKLGKQKFKLTYKDVDHVSCVFGTGKSRKPYKTVNIKPVAKISAHERIVERHKPQSRSKDASHVETNILLTKKQSKPERDLTVKKKRPKISI